MGPITVGPVTIINAEKRNEIAQFKSKIKCADLSDDKTRGLIKTDFEKYLCDNIDSVHFYQNICVIHKVSHNKPLIVKNSTYEKLFSHDIINCFIFSFSGLLYNPLYENESCFNRRPEGNL